MLPPQISGIHRQYKEDSNSIAAWLASTARTYGYTGPENLDSSDTTTSESPRTENHMGKTKGKTTQANPWISKPSKHVVAVDEFLPLAEYIAKLQEPVVSVPPAFVTTLDRLIRVRGSFDDMLESHSSDSDDESDHEQGHFVRTMEAVKSALRSRMPKAQAPKTTPTEASADSPTQDQAHELDMRFALVSINDPSRALVGPLVDASPQRPKARKEDRVAYEVEKQTSQEEVIFIWLALVADLNRVRSRISWIWSHHKCGGIDHAAAAVATNVAISFARGLVEDSTPILETHPDGIAGLIHYAYVAVCASQGYSPEDVLQPGSDQDQPELYDIARKTYHLAFDTMKLLVGRTRPGVLTLIMEDTLGTYNPEVDRNIKSKAEKFQDDKILLLRIFNELMTVMRILPDYPVEDELMRCLREADKTRKVSLSLAFAAQIYLDIHHIMGQEIALTFCRWADEIDLMMVSLRRQIVFNSSIKAMEAVSPSLQAMLNDIASMAADPVYVAKRKAYSDQDQIMSDEVNRIMCISPVISGLFLFRQRFMQREIGIWFVHDMGAVRHAAHLYNALEMEELLKHRWRDMDLIVDVLGAESFWGREERPRTLEDTLKACGSMKNEKFGNQSIGKGLPVSRVFVMEIIKGEKSEWTMERIKDIAARSYEVDESPDGNFNVAQIVDLRELKRREKERNAAKENEKKKRKKSKASVGRVEATVDPDHLIRGLTIALQSETLEMAFPYLVLHRGAWDLLRQVKTECEPFLEELHLVDHIPDDMGLPAVAEIILRDSACGGKPDRRSLEGAAKVLGEMIAAGKLGENCVHDLEEHIEIDVGLWIGSEEEMEHGDAEQEEAHTDVLDN